MTALCRQRSSDMAAGISCPRFPIRNSGRRRPTMELDNPVSLPRLGSFVPAHGLASWFASVILTREPGLIWMQHFQVGVDLQEPPDRTHPIDPFPAALLHELKTPTAF